MAATPPSCSGTCIWKGCPGSGCPTASTHRVWVSSPPRSCRASPLQRTALTRQENPMAFCGGRLGSTALAGLAISAITLPDAAIRSRRREPFHRRPRPPQQVWRRPADIDIDGPDVTPPDHGRRNAYLALFDPRTATLDRIALVERGDEIGGMSRTTRTALTTIEITDVQLLGPDHAELRYTLPAAGHPRPEDRIGEAVRTAGGRKIAATTVWGLITVGGGRSEGRREGTSGAVARPRGPKGGTIPPCGPPRPSPAPRLRR